MNKCKRRKGFSLAEMIISVAILAIMSIYLLKLFGNSQRLNDAAFELDGATNCLKSHLTMLQNESRLITDFAERVESTEEDSHVLSSKIYLDSAFEETEVDHSAYVLMTDFKKVEMMPNGEALFMVKANIQRQEENGKSEIVAEIGTNMIFRVDGGER